MTRRPIRDALRDGHECYAVVDAVGAPRALRTRQGSAAGTVAKVLFTVERK